MDSVCQEAVSHCCRMKIRFRSFEFCTFCKSAFDMSKCAHFEASEGVASSGSSSITIYNDHPGPVSVAKDATIYFSC